MELKTLYERLKPEIKDNLEKEKNIYPHICTHLLSVLHENVAVTQLTFADINSLTDFSPTSVLRILEIYDMFED